MQVPEWLAHARAVQDRVAGAGLSGPDGMAVALLELAAVLDATPLQFIKAHETIAEDDFSRRRREATARYVGDDFDPIPSTDPVQVLFELAARIAALDSLRHELVGALAPGDPNVAWRVRGLSQEQFLVPRRRLYREPSRRGPQRRIVRRDLMAQHRILPLSVGSFDVRLHWRDLNGRWPLDALFGAGLFPGLDLRKRKEGGQFVVTDVVSADQVDIVRLGVTSSHEYQCAALVFPELTVPPRVDAEIRQLLQSRMLWADPEFPSCPTLTVAGSWHEKREGSYVNVATVYDAHGEEILRHHKMLTYRDDKLGSEMIEPGSVLNVLVTEEALIAFGICLDFCERARRGPFADLDVDYVLVPSCGDRTTMAGHLDTAREIRMRYRSRVFVVQQALPEDLDDKGEIFGGFVLPPISELDLKPDETIEYDPWSLWQAD